MPKHWELQTRFSHIVLLTLEELQRHILGMEFLRWVEWEVNWGMQRPFHLTWSTRQMLSSTLDIWRGWGDKRPQPQNSLLADLHIIAFSPVCFSSKYVYRISDFLLARRKMQNELLAEDGVVSNKPAVEWSGRRQWLVQAVIQNTCRHATRWAVPPESVTSVFWLFISLRSGSAGSFF